MRRLVADLLLLARTDVGRVVAAHAAATSPQIVVEAAGELGPVSDEHEHRPSTCSRRPSRATATSCTVSRSTSWRTRCATPRRAPRCASRTATRPDGAGRAGRRRRRPRCPARARAHPLRALRARRRRPRRLVRARPGDRARGASPRRRVALLPRRLGHAAWAPAAAPTPGARLQSVACCPRRLRPRRRRAAPSGGASGGRRPASRGRRAAAAAGGRPRGSPPRRRVERRPRRSPGSPRRSSPASSRNGTPRKITSGSATEPPSCSAIVDHHDEDAVGREHPPVAQRDVGHVADLDAVDEDHAGLLGLAEARAALVDVQRQPVARPGRCPPARRRPPRPAGRAGAAA